jgi:hypothetical protein
MNIRDRLMSRASVAVMAAFAPDPPAADHSKVGQLERVEDAAPGDGGSHDPLGGLTAEEQAAFEAMTGEGAPADGKGEAELEPDIDRAAEDDDYDDPEPDGASDGDPAPRDGDGVKSGDKPGEESPARKPPKTINYGRHQKELQKAAKEREDLQKQLDAAKKEAQENREARTRLDERTKLLLEAINTKAPAAPAAPKENTDPEPDADADPLGHSQWEIRQLKKTVSDLTAGRQQEQEVSAAEQEERQVYGEFSASLEQEARSDETFAEAFVHLRETRFRELGFIYADIDITDTAQCNTLTAAQQAQLSRSIQEAFYNEQIMTARAARQAGRNPAKVVKSLAIARGWQPKAAAGDPPADPPPRTNGKGNGKDHAPPARREPPPSVSDQLDAIRRNQQDGKSLSDAGGAEGGEITAERLANMSNEEFERFYESVPKDKFDRMMGKVPM